MNKNLARTNLYLVSDKHAAATLGGNPYWRKTDRHMTSATSNEPKSPHESRWKFRVGVAVGVVMYAFLLEYAYVNFAADRFAYLRYFYVVPDRILMTLGLCFHVVTAWTLNCRWKRPSDVIAWMTFSLVVVPIGVIPFFSGAIEDFEALIWSIGAAATLLVMNRLWSIKTLNFVPITQRSAWPLWTVLIAFSALTYGAMAATVGLSIDLPGLFSVYDVRDEYKSTLATSSPILGYLLSNQGNVVNPLLMVLGARRRNIAIILCGVFGQFFIYSETGFKAIFLSVPVAISLGWLLRRRSNLRSTYFLHAINIVALLAVIVDSIKDIGLVQIFVNRLMITPGYLTAIYADFYSGAPKHKWSYSFLEGISQSPYQLAPSEYLGQHYFGILNLNVNANMFADGFANWGVLGIAIEAPFLIVTAILLNSAARGLPISVVTGVLLLPVIGLVNGSPVTALLSYGFALAVVVFALCPRDEAMARDRPPFRHAAAVR